jgi:polysaccharide export outer membrane protein
MNNQKKRNVKLGIVLAFIFQIALSFIGSAMGQEEAYLIGPRDVLSLSIYAGGELQQEVSLTVTAQGLINVPFAGQIRAEGLTTSQLEALIITPLSKDYFVNPEVNVYVKEYHSLRYYISGAVRDPGLYETSSKATLMQLIAKAGGAMPDRGNVAYILRDSTDQISGDQDVEHLLSRSKEPRKVDLKSLLDKGDMTYNVALQSGDVVYIPFEKTMNLAESKIYVEGEVKSPGVYDYQPGMTALNACIMAGGFDRFAAPNRTRIIRKQGGRQEIIRIDLNEVKMGRLPDVELKPGDMINVPETWL